MDNWLTIINNEQLLYKGCKENSFDNNRHGPCWFALDESIGEMYANGYAEREGCGEFFACRLKQPIRLLNILDLTFKQDFWNKINKTFSANNCVDPRKQVILSLGLPSFEIQQKSLKIDFSKCDDNINYWAQMLGGHRFSNMEIDKQLAELIQEFYPDKCDGFIQPYNVPTCIQNSLFFPREVCIFDVSKFLSDVTKISVIRRNSKKGGRKQKKGGTTVTEYACFLYRDSITADDWKNVNLDNAKAAGYKGPKTEKITMKDIEEDRERQQREENKKQLEKYANIKEPKIIYI